MAMSKKESEKQLETSVAAGGDGIVEAFAVHVPDDVRTAGYQQSSPEQGQVIIYRYQGSTPDNRNVQCCYPIVLADPIEMARARTVAIAQLCFEVGLLLLCRSWGCVLAFLLAIPFASIVACCSKHRTTYLAWSSTGTFVCWLHAVAAAETFGQDMALFLIQIGLCCLTMVAIFYGCKVASLLRNSIHPGADVEVQVPSQAPTYRPVEILSQQASVSPEG